MNRKLYTYYRSSCSYRIRIALHLMGLNFESIPVHLVKNGGHQNSDDYKKLNPKAEVPFYVDNQVSLSQSMAILFYLDEQLYSSKLFGESPNRYHRISLCEIINSGIQPLQNLKVLQELQGRFGMSEEQKISWIRDFIHRGFEAYENSVQDTAGNFSCGDTVSAPDVFLVPQVYNANRFGMDLRVFPKIQKINENCLQLEAFKRAAPENQRDAEN